MIVDVALAPEALVDLSAYENRRAALAVLRGLVDRIRSHGCLAFISVSEQKAFLNFIRDSTQLTDGDRKRWQEVVILMLREGRAKLFVGSSAPRLTSLSHALEQFVLDADTIAIVGLDEFNTRYPEAVIGVHEVSPVLSIALVDTLVAVPSIERRQVLLAHGAHPTGTSRDVVWADLFRPAASRFSDVALVDRYLFQRIAESGRAEHITWFLTSLARDGHQNLRVALYGSSEPGSAVPPDARSISEMIMQAWNSDPGPIVELSVVVARDWRRDRLPHNRHVRFGASVAYVMEEGFDRLASHQVRDPDGLNWKYVWSERNVSEYAARERRIDRADVSFWKLTF